MGSLIVYASMNTKSIKANKKKVLISLLIVVLVVLFSDGLSNNILSSRLKKNNEYNFAIH